MKLETIKKTLEVVKYTVDNKATISQIMEEFSISRKTAQTYTNINLKKLLELTKIQDVPGITLEEVVNLIKDMDEIKTNNQTLSTIDIDPDELAKIKIQNIYTNEYLASKYNVSESTIKNKLKLVSDDMKQPLELINKINEQVGKKVGGLNSLATKKLNSFEIEWLACMIIKNDLTIKELSLMIDIPKSTIFEYLKTIENDELNSQLKEVFDRHKKHNNGNCKGIKC